jgi:thioredoxin 1
MHKVLKKIYKMRIMSNYQIYKIKLMMGILLLAFTTGVNVFAQQKSAIKKGDAGQEIAFENTSWKDVAAVAKKSGKHIFVDAYTTWCGPCKLLKSTTFKDKNAAVFFNNNFINYTADMEKGEGLMLAEQWNITAYPTLLFFSPDGKMVLKQVGYVDGEKLIDFGKQVVAKR